jgi:hypothetical protein
MATTNKKRAKRYLTVNMLRERWGDCSHMLIERKLRDDPTFPRYIKVGKARLFDEDDVEAYERAAAARTGTER